jgi:UDP-glucose 4-epimerase
MGAGHDVEHAPARAGDIRHSEADIGRARRELGYAPRVAFADGLRRTVEHLAGQPVVGIGVAA